MRQGYMITRSSLTMTQEKTDSKARAEIAEQVIHPAASGGENMTPQPAD